MLKGILHFLFGYAFGELQQLFFHQLQCDILSYLVQECIQLAFFEANDCEDW